MVQRKVRIYDVATVILLFRYFAFNSAILSLPNVVDKFLLFLGLAGYAWIIINQEIRKKSFAVCVLLSSVALYTSIQIKSWFILSTLLCIIATKSVHIKDFIVLSKRILSLLLLLQALLSVVLYIVGSSNYLYVILMGEVRFMFGMIHPNVLAAVLVNIILVDVINIYDDDAIEKNIYFVIKTLFAYVLTKSSGLLVILFVAVVLVNLAKIQVPFIKKAIYHAAKYGPIVLMAGVFFTAKEYWNLGIDYLSYINNFVIRLKEGAYLLAHEGLTIWGNNAISGVISWTADWRLNYVNVDNLYVMFMVTIGIGWFCIIEFGIIQILKEKEDILVPIFIVIWAAYGMTEVHAVNIFLFFPMIFFGKLFDNNKSEREEYYG